MIEIGAAPQYFLAFAVVLARMGGLMAFAPFWGSFAVPARIRVVLAVALTFALFPILAPRIPEIPADPAVFAVGLGKELLVGLLLGLVGQLFLAALQLGGTVMGFQMGFSLVNVIDPQTQVQVSVLSVLHNLAGLLLFVVLNAHHWYLRAMLDSYQMVPVFGASMSSGLSDEVVRLGGQMFVLGVQLAAPVMFVGLTIDILLGIIGRAAPQIHILIAGMPLKVLMGFVVLTLSASALVPYFERYLGEMRHDFSRVLGLLGGA